MPKKPTEYQGNQIRVLISQIAKNDIGVNSFNIDGLAINSEDFTSFCDAIKLNDHLISINLNDSGLDYERLNQFSEALSQSKSIKEVDIGYNLKLANEMLDSRDPNYYGRNYDQLFLENVTNIFKKFPICKSLETIRILSSMQKSNIFTSETLNKLRENDAKNFEEKVEKPIDPKLLGDIEMIAIAPSVSISYPEASNIDQSSEEKKGANR